MSVFYRYCVSLHAVSCRLSPSRHSLRACFYIADPHPLRSVSALVTSGSCLKTPKALGTQVHCQHLAALVTAVQGTSSLESVFRTNSSTWWSPPNQVMFQALKSLWSHWHSCALGHSPRHFFLFQVLGNTPVFEETNEAPAGNPAVSSMAEYTSGKAEGHSAGSCL